MSLVNNLRKELSELKAIDYITSVFTDINAAKLKRIQESFKINAQFYEEVGKSYHLVNLIANKKGLIKKKKHKEKEKQLYIIVTSNHRFYGTLNIDVLEKAVGDYSKMQEKPACIVIGQTGKDYFQTEQPAEDWEPVIFKRDYPDQEEVNSLLSKVESYKKALVYYPRFVSVFEQIPSVMDITQKPSKTQSEFQDIDFIVEPEIPKMMKFFKQQVTNLLFNRTVLEAELSRTAARLWAMTRADERAQSSLNTLRQKVNKAEKSEKNARLLNVFSALNVGGFN